MGNRIETISMQVDVQENLIIRNGITGEFMGRLDPESMNTNNFENLKQYDKKVNSGSFSDGYHTFDELYWHRMILFSIVCNSNKLIAWKSWLHHDDTMYENYFIVGIDTPEGQYSYHYHKNFWDYFNVKVLDNAPEWDGHKPKDLLRLLSLNK